MAPSRTSNSDPVTGTASPTLQRVLASAARLQQLVPDAVLVGGSAAAMCAAHRESVDHVHVLEDLDQRFDQVLEALESSEGWVTNRVTPGKIILGQLGDIEAGVRQMRRRTPLELAEVRLPDGQALRVPTLAETLRIKAWLIVYRNQTRDYLDVAALAERMGLDQAAISLAGIDQYYADQQDTRDGVASQLVRQLSDPRPADPRVTSELSHYKGLKPPWNDWRHTVAICNQLADRMLQTD